MGLAGLQYPQHTRELQVAVELGCIREGNLRFYGFAVLYATRTSILAKILVQRSE